MQSYIDILTSESQSMQLSKNCNFFPYFSSYYYIIIARPCLRLLRPLLLLLLILVHVCNCQYPNNFESKCILRHCRSLDQPLCPKNRKNSVCSNKNESKIPSIILGQIIYIIEGGSSPSRYKRKFCISIALIENFLEECTLVPFISKSQN